MELSKDYSSKGNNEREYKSENFIIKKNPFSIKFDS